MTQYFQITVNEILSGICKAIDSVYGSTISIYKEKQEHLDLPAVTVYCINYEKTKGRNDRFTNIFDIIINYFPDDNVIINNKRTDMFAEAEKILDAIEYIQLPAYTKDDKDNLIERTLPSRCRVVSIEEKEGFMQINVSYTVRTKKYMKNPKMEQLEYNESIGG